MEAPLADQIVIAAGPTFEVYDTNTRVAESECASVRIDAHPRTMPRVRAWPSRRPTPRAGCGSKYRWDLKRRENIRREPAARPRTVSTNQSAAVLRRPRLSGAGRPAH